MGGMGSGRYGAGYVRGKDHVEGKQSVSIGIFSESFKTGEKSSFTVTSPADKNKKIGSVTINPNDLYIHFDYSNVDLRIYVDQTPCHYGGFRYWFLCPSCGQRCGKVYNQGTFLACRKCCDLNYFSQQHTKTDCYYYKRKAEQIARKIDKNYEYSGTRPIFPPKPKYMKWAAYWRLHRRFYDYSDKSSQVWLRGAMNILSR